MALLAKEKELTRLRDELARQRRALPWVRVAGCKHCSFWADSFNGIGVHLAHRDVSFVAMSRAPLAKIEAFRRRMGWSFRWRSSFGSDFNYDYGVSFAPEALRGEGAVYNYTRRERERTDHAGISVFHRDAAGAVFHTYSTYARGLDLLNCAYSYLDLVPKGRNEDRLALTQAWVRHHGGYDDRLPRASGPSA